MHNLNKGQASRQIMRVAQLIWMGEFILQLGKCPYISLDCTKQKKKIIS